ncbi:hypothetical protein PQY72_00785 [Pelagibacteraceae bacterium]|nr:hypothetical protein [Pelagibacteraceae bacterium]
MKKINFKTILILAVANCFIFSNTQSQINNQIIVKVGDEIITSVDIKNEIMTNLLINNQEISQNIIDQSKNFAIKKLINKSIKKSEIEKYEIKDYNQIDLQNYIKSVAKNLNTNTNDLKEIFSQSNISYQTFVDSRKIELLWNTLIFQIYRNQTNINTVEVENEFEQVKKNENEEELKELKQKILNKKKEEKLSLFSRSHFSNLENTVIINFK